MQFFFNFKNYCFFTKLTVEIALNNIKKHIILKQMYNNLIFFYIAINFIKLLF